MLEAAWVQFLTPRLGNIIRVMPGSVVGQVDPATIPRQDLPAGQAGQRPNPGRGCKFEGWARRSNCSTGEAERGAWAPPLCLGGALPAPVKGPGRLAVEGRLPANGPVAGSLFSRRPARGGLRPIAPRLPGLDQALAGRLFGDR